MRGAINKRLFSLVVICLISSMYLVGVSMVVASEFDANSLFGPEDEQKTFLKGVEMFVGKGKQSTPSERTLEVSKQLNEEGKKINIKAKDLKFRQKKRASSSLLSQEFKEGNIHEYITAATLAAHAHEIWRSVAGHGSFDIPGVEIEGSTTKVDIKVENTVVKEIKGITMPGDGTQRDITIDKYKRLDDDFAYTPGDPFVPHPEDPKKNFATDYTVKDTRPNGFKEINRFIVDYYTDQDQIQNASKIAEQFKSMEVEREIIASNGESLQQPREVHSDILYYSSGADKGERKSYSLTTYFPDGGRNAVIERSDIEYTLVNNVKTGQQVKLPSQYTEVSTIADEEFKGSVEFEYDNEGRIDFVGKDGKLNGDDFRSTYDVKKRDSNGYVTEFDTVDVVVDRKTKEETRTETTREIDRMDTFGRALSFTDTIKEIKRDRDDTILSSKDVVIVVTNVVYDTKGLVRRFKFERTVDGILDPDPTTSEVAKIVYNSDGSIRKVIFS